MCCDTPFCFILFYFCVISVFEIQRKLPLASAFSIWTRMEGNLAVNKAHQWVHRCILPDQFPDRELVFFLSVEVDHNNRLCHSQVTFYKLYEITSSQVESLKWILLTFVSVTLPWAAACHRRRLCYCVLCALTLWALFFFLLICKHFAVIPSLVFPCYRVQPSFVTWSLLLFAEREVVRYFCIWQTSWW